MLSRAWDCGQGWLVVRDCLVRRDRVSLDRLNCVGSTPNHAGVCPMGKVNPRDSPEPPPAN